MNALNNKIGSKKPQSTTSTLQPSASQSSQPPEPPEASEPRDISELLDRPSFHKPGKLPDCCPNFKLSGINEGDIDIVAKMLGTNDPK